MCTTCDTNALSVVILPYQGPMFSLMTIAISAYSSKSTSLLLVSGGSCSAQGRGSPSEAVASPSTRRMKSSVSPRVAPIGALLSAR